MTEKAAAVLAVFVMLLLGAAHVAYGYWTDRIAVQEEIAVVWPVEVEIQETEEEDPEAEHADSLPDAEAVDGAGSDAYVPEQTTAAEGDHV